MPPALRQPVAARSARAFWRDPSAATSVEFAITASFLLLLVFAVFQLGMVGYRRNVAAEAARFGVRWAMVRGNDSGRPSNASGVSMSDTIRARIGESQLNASIAYLKADGSSGGTNALGNRVQVTVSYPNPLAITRLFPSISTSATAQSAIVY